MLNSMKSPVVQSVLALGIWGPFFIALLDSAFVPLAQSVDLLILAQATMAPGTAYLAALLAVIGSTLGSFLLYTMSQRGSRWLLGKRLSGGQFEKMRLQIETHGALALILPTMLPLPLPMRPLVIAAGVFRMRPERFLASIALARTVRYFGLAFASVHFGEAALTFLQQHALEAVAILAALGVFSFVLHRGRTRSQPVLLFVPAEVKQG